MFSLLQSSRSIRTLFLTIPLAIVAAQNSYADMIQSDWSGSDGILGPVTVWSSDFYSSDSMNCSQDLSLEYVVFEDQYLFAELVVDTSTVAGGPSNPIVMDINGDSYADFLFARNNGTNNYSYVAYLNDGQGTGWSSGTVYSWFQNYGVPKKAADMDGDGDLDLAVGFREPLDDMHYGVVWVENNGTTSNWNEHYVVNYSGPYDRSLLDIMDINGDGLGDLLIHIGYQANNTRIFRNLGNGTSWSEYVLWGGQKNPDHFFDIDGDDDLDMIVDDNVIWINQNGLGSSWYSYTEPYLYGLSIQKTSDIDLDGDDDLVVKNDGWLYWYENQSGGSSWIPHLIDSTGCSAAQVCDFDLDGDDDLLWFHDEDLFYMENPSDPTEYWGNSLVFTYDDDYAGKGYGDFDGNGLGDFLLCQTVPGHYDLKILARYPYERYRYSGELVSSILQVEPDLDDVLWGWLLYECETSSAGSIDVQVRASTDPLNMGIWSPALESGADLGTYCTPDENYFQYKISLSTSDSTYTPSFSEFAIAYSTPVMLESSGINETRLVGTSCNPANSSTSILFELAQSGTACLDVYDLMGRHVTRLAYGEFETGIQSSPIGNLPDGLYSIILTTAEGLFTQKVVVLN